MNSPHTPFPLETSENLPGAKPKRVPRLASLKHRLQHAKDADGQPLELHDELLFFLEDPPEGTRDRWQAGADLCESHGIKTSRMSVWRFFNANILQWRREQAPPLPAQLPDPEETARLHEMARHLAAQRALEMLNNPGLSPGHLVGFIQNENHRQQIQLGRDQFNDRVAVRRLLQDRDHYRAIDAAIRDKHMFEAQISSLRNGFAQLLKCASHTTS